MTLTVPLKGTESWENVLLVENSKFNKGLSSSYRVSYTFAPQQQWRHPPKKWRRARQQMPRRTLSAYLRQIKKNIWAKNMHAVQIWQLYTAIYIFWLIQSLLFLFATLKHFLQLLFVSLFITLPFRKFLERNTFFLSKFQSLQQFFNWNFSNTTLSANVSFDASVFLHQHHLLM